MEEENLSSLSMSDNNESISSLSMSEMDEADAIIESLVPDLKEEEEEVVVEDEYVIISYKLKYEYGYDNSPCESSYGRADELIEDVMSKEFILAIRDGSFKNPVVEYHNGDEVLSYKGEDCISFLEGLSAELARNPNPDGAI